jgi:hypothetical protein
VFSVVLKSKFEFLEVNASTPIQQCVKTLQDEMLPVFLEK